MDITTWDIKQPSMTTEKTPHGEFSFIISTTIDIGTSARIFSYCFKISDTGLLVNCDDTTIIIRTFSGSPIEFTQNIHLIPFYVSVSKQDEKPLICKEPSIKSETLGVIRNPTNMNVTYQRAFQTSNTMTSTITYSKEVTDTHALELSAKYSFKHSFGIPGNTAEKNFELSFKYGYTRSEKEAYSDALTNTVITTDTTTLTVVVPSNKSIRISRDLTYRDCIADATVELSINYPTFGKVTKIIDPVLINGILSEQFLSYSFVEL